MRRIGWALALLALAPILAVYAERVVMALPIYAGDEGAYLIRALFSPDVASRNPYAAEVNNTVFMLIIRAVELTGEDYLVWLRGLGLAAYAGGLYAVWRAGVADLTRREQMIFLLLAFAFPYYRFVVTALPEGWFVGMLGLIVWVTADLYRRKPAAHALVAGGLTAVLLLIKPHGLAVAAGLVALMTLDAVWAGVAGLKRLPVRLAAFTLGFLAVGGAIQVLAGHPSETAFSFFVGDFYGRTLRNQPVPGAAQMGLLALGGMISTMLVMAGPALAIGAWTIVARRWRTRGPAAMLQTQELMFLFLALCMAATLAMVAIYAFKVAGDVGETRRIWGRYFEFYVPLLWLAAAPFVVRAETRRLRPALIAGAAATFAGLVGLLVCFRNGVVLLPWDNTALNAFFLPDPVRAPLGAAFPYRRLAIAATAAAAVLAIASARPSRVWIALLLGLGLLSSALDYSWIGDMVRNRTELDRQLDAASPFVPRAPGETVAIASDNNVGHLGFLAFDGAPTVIIQPPGPIPNAVKGARAIVLLGAQSDPPGRGWRRRYAGSAVTVYQRDPTAP